MNDKDSNIVIALDGPVGCGKSTVAKAVAKKLGFMYLDTGAMYRALTLKAIKENLNLEDEQALTRLSKNVDIRLKMQDDTLKVFLDGADVSEQIRTPELTNKVFFVAKLKGVRANMVDLQRKVASQNNCVVEGRDIGTVVFPDAFAKFYLDADVEVRAQRRFKELTQKGTKTTMERVLQETKIRDNKDTTRKVAPLLKAKDAIYIDTTGLTVDEAVNKALEHVKIK